jgi:hypothetical protein
MKLRLTSLTALAVLTVSLFAAPRSADASVITMQLTGLITQTEFGPVFGEVGTPIPFGFSLTYDTSKGSQTAFVNADSGGEDFYGYSAAGITASSLTFGTKTWTLANLQPLSTSGNQADFWTNADLMLGAPTSVAVRFGDAEGRLALGTLYIKTGHALLETVDISEFFPDSYNIVAGSYTLSTSDTPAAVPEPASLLFVGTGLVGLAMRLRSAKAR